MVRGYHVYQDEWDTVIGEVLQCRKETGNWHDPYVVVTLSDGWVIGHMPQKFCFFAQSLFGVVALSHVVSDHRRYSADLEQGILEIPCKIKFSTSSSVEKGEGRKIGNSYSKQ